MTSYCLACLFIHRLPLRLPTDSNDPACALPTLDEYLALVRGVGGTEMESQAEIFRSDTHMFVAPSSLA